MKWKMLYRCRKCKFITNVNRDLFVCPSCGSLWGDNCSEWHELISARWVNEKKLLDYILFRKKGYWELNKEN